MKPGKETNKKDTNKTMKIVNAMIVAMVVAGAVIFSVINQAASGRDYMTTIFLAFLGAIITIQIIPCVVLLGSIAKGIVSLVHKPESIEAANRDK